ncbi:MAG: hypothetical protein RLZZ562_396, partial [Planctomycetota bacterium]
GNVWEWCADVGAVNYSTSPVNDPYETNGSNRVFRGGSWQVTADECRSAHRRLDGFPTYADINIGFRIVLAPTLAPYVPPASLNMVPIQTAPFSMGSAAVAGQGLPATPVHQVTLTQPFWMGKFEVTQAEYQARMGANPSTFIGTSRPVETVSRSNALAYCAALNTAYAGQIPAGYSFRLPTEAEWEYCCRAGTTTEWNTGSVAPTCGQANVGIDILTPCVGSTANVGSYAANAFGLHDMHGNVGEWVLDKSDITTSYPSTPVTNPYVQNGRFAICRGGNYIASGTATASAVRGLSPLFPSAANGFRIVLAPTLPITNP